MPVLVLLVALLIAILVWRVLASSRRGQKDRSRKRRRSRSKSGKTSGCESSYRAVSINYGLEGCSLVEALVGRRFLEAEAPKLPLKGCRQPRCHCKYEHHEDRRDPDGDRRLGFGLAAEVHERTGTSERRGAKRRGRRKTD